jgi:hypothetical protein
MRKYYLAAALVLITALFGCGDDNSTKPEPVTVEATFEVSPAAGTIITEFAFDAGASTTTGGTLEFRWDSEGDGAWNTDWSESPLITHRFSLYEVSAMETVEVRLQAKSGSGSDTAYSEVVIDARHGIKLLNVLTESPGMTALGSDGTHLWLADWGAPGTGRIYKVDPATGDTLYSVPSPDAWPCGVAWDGTNLWVTGYLKVRKLDPLTGDVLDDISVAYSQKSGGLAWDGENFYHSSSGTAHGADGRIHKYAADGTHLGAFDSPHGNPDLSGLAFDGEHLWVTVDSDDSLYVYDKDTGAILRSFSVQGRYGDVAVLGDHIWSLAGGGLTKIVP